MPTFLYIIAAVVLLIVILLLRFRRRYNAAMNVYMARYTFDRLPRPQKGEVKEEAKQMVLGRGMAIDGYEHDIERFGWYAVAMDALNIESRLPENPRWYKIKNPSKAIKRNDAFLKRAAYLIKQNYSIDINIQ